MKILSDNQLLFSLLASVLLAYISGSSYLNFTFASQVELSIILFTAFLLIQTFLVVSKFNKEKDEHILRWRLHESYDEILSKIHNSFYKITDESYMGQDLFVAYFTKQLQTVETGIKEVADRNSLRVKAGHFLYIDNVLDAFKGDTEKIWRYTWEILHEQQLFDDIHWRLFFEKTAKMAASDNITAIRSILVISDAQYDATIAKFKPLFDFFYTNKGQTCRIIKKSDYTGICIDYIPNQPYEDFGIYGNQLLFLTEQYKPEIIGIFTKNKTTIQQYIRLFDAMWNSDALMKTNPSSATTTVTLEELFKNDGTQ